MDSTISQDADTLMKREKNKNKKRVIGSLEMHMDGN